jgi:hypothetical protein
MAARLPAVLATLLIFAAPAPVRLSGAEGPRTRLHEELQGATVSSLNHQRTAEACHRDERQARETLEQSWNEFAGAGQDRCVCA